MKSQSMKHLKLVKIQFKITCRFTGFGVVTSANPSKFEKQIKHNFLQFIGMNSQPSTPKEIIRLDRDCI